MKKIVISEQRRAEIIARLQDTGITLAELRALLGADRDSSARNWVTREIKPNYPVICTSHGRGYLIPTRPEHLELAKRAAMENHRKAATLHRNTNVLDRWIIRTEAQQGASLFENEIHEIKRNI